MNILFVGDVMLGRLVNEVLKDMLPAYPWGDTLSLFQVADVRICNLECVISDWGTPWSVTPKVFHFRSDAKNVEALRVAQIDAVSLANNHTLDFEYEGLCHMLNNLDAAGLHHAGAGTTLDDASKPAVWETKGIKLGFIAFTDNEPAWEATLAHPGILYVPIVLEDRRAEKLLTMVSKTKDVVDFLIVSAHWGPNWGYTPPAEHIPFARALVDAGADVIFGHSGHIVRGVEVYKDKPIMYCAGNFIDDYAVDEIERNDWSCIFIVEIDGYGISRLLLYPTIIQNFQARRAPPAERDAIMAMMRKLCADLKTATIWNKEEERLEIEIDVVPDLLKIPASPS